MLPLKKTGALALLPTIHTTNTSPAVMVLAEIGMLKLWTIFEDDPVIVWLPKSVPAIAVP